MESDDLSLLASGIAHPFPSSNESSNSFKTDTHGLGATTDNTKAQWGTQTYPNFPNLDQLWTSASWMPFRSAPSLLSRGGGGGGGDSWWPTTSEKLQLWFFRTTRSLVMICWIYRLRTMYAPHWLEQSHLQGMQTFPYNEGCLEIIRSWVENHCKRILCFFVEVLMTCIDVQILLLVTRAPILLSMYWCGSTSHRATLGQGGW